MVAEPAGPSLRFDDVVDGAALKTTAVQATSQWDTRTPGNETSAACAALQY